MSRLADPMQQLIADALDAVGISYRTGEAAGNAQGLDFYLPFDDLHIEVKRGHIPQVSDQLSRAENVIIAQGETAIMWLAEAIRGIGK